ncbi:helix-turn-helix transcriptional regulator [Clostridium oryzae]|uniref:HTH domain protein n=1 Tax=Clostridium oryzae TaxID=1450648 RepID=A0A1V4ISF4_9CLOT|nr:YafY family protein [Clostridium oryzae]OPJ62856.1 HTH domain protein [Clostridium oryzae]
MRLHRMISILLLVEAKGKVKAKELAAELEISVRTVYRDIDSLCEAGVPLTTDTGPNGGIHFVEGYRVGIKNMQPDEIINLYLGGMGVKADKKSDMAMKVNTALLKLQKNLSPGINENLNKIKKRFYVDDTPWWGEKRSLGNIDILLQSLWQNTKLSITYTKHNGEVSNRNIMPYGIVVKQADWYLVAYCEMNKDIRTFKCERITACKTLDDDFIFPTNFSVEEFWKRNHKQFVNECKEKEQYPVTIRLGKCFEDKLDNFQVYKVEKKDECIEAIVNMHKYEFAIGEVLDIIGCAEILAPVELRDFVKKRLQIMLKKYDF